MSWFKRLRHGVTTKTREKKETPDGIWHMCKKCQTPTIAKELKEHLYVCPHCSHHERIGALEYFSILFDNGKWTELHADLAPVDFLEFEDVKPYKQRLEEAKAKTGLDEAMSLAVGKVNKQSLVVAAMNFKFIGGSMGAVMGEKIARGVDHAIETNSGFMIISKSGGARMMESAFSLMQMAKSSAKLNQLSAAGLPYISFLTDPTTGGVTASFAMLGDVNIAEPNALIGFAGPRVIKETIMKDLPEGFQRSEFLIEKGFLDFIVPRTQLKERVSDILAMLKP